MTHISGWAASRSRCCGDSTSACRFMLPTCADQRRPGNQFTLAGYCVRTVREVTTMNEICSPFAKHSSSTERCGSESRETHPLTTVYWYDAVFRQYTLIHKVRVYVAGYMHNKIKIHRRPQPRCLLVAGWQGEHSVEKREGSHRGSPSSEETRTVPVDWIPDTSSCSLKTSPGDCWTWSPGFGTLDETRASDTNNSSLPHIWRYICRV